MTQKGQLYRNTKYQDKKKSHWITMEQKGINGNLPWVWTVLQRFVVLLHIKQHTLTGHGCICMHTTLHVQINKVSDDITCIL